MSNNVTISLTGLSSRELRVFEQAHDRLKAIKDLEDRIDNDQFTKLYTAQFHLTDQMKEVISGDDNLLFKSIKYDCEGLYGVSLNIWTREIKYIKVQFEFSKPGIPVSGTTLEEFLKQPANTVTSLHFTGKDLQMLHQAIAHVFYNLK